MSNSPFYDANIPIKSRALNEVGRANYDKIFRKGEETIEAMDEAEPTQTCENCRGRGYDIIRETTELYGCTKHESHREECQCCGGTGEAKIKI